MHRNCAVVDLNTDEKVWLFYNILDNETTYDAKPINYAEQEIDGYETPLTPTPGHPTPAHTSQEAQPYVQGIPIHG